MSASSRYFPLRVVPRRSLARRSCSWSTLMSAILYVGGIHREIGRPGEGVCSSLGGAGWQLDPDAGATAVAVAGESLAPMSFGDALDEREAQAQRALLAGGGAGALVEGLEDAVLFAREEARATV